MNNSSECLQCGLDKLKKEFEDMRLKHQIEGLIYKTYIDSNGFYQELAIDKIPDNVLITILKDKGYQITKSF
jgi:hypothetical protein